MTEILIFTAMQSLIETIRTLCRLTIQDKFYNMIGNRIHLEEVKDGETRHILSYDVTFFDIHSTKLKQFGFTLTLNNGRKLTCAGDEPYNPVCEKYVRGSDWLLHEAFCLYAERDIWKPYEKHHSTVKDACELAESWGSRTSYSGTRRTAMLPVGNGFIRVREKRYYSGKYLCAG